MGEQMVVAIGASAGGLEALTDLFDHVADEPGVPFVVVQHLSPNYRSFMPELLAKHTSMRIVVAEHGMELAANTVYLTPARMLVGVNDNRFVFQEPEWTDVVNHPIDFFFKSVAEQFQDRAVAVVLSGTGSDGAKGVQYVKESGGFVVVQSEASAKFNGMPHNAAATGAADHVVDTSQIWPTIAEHVIQKQSLMRWFQTLQDYQGYEQNFHRILDLLFDRHQVDFHQYKRQTLLRRLERRMTTLRIRSMEAYIQRLEQDVQEADRLMQEFLIHVTEFFRDVSVFDYVVNQLAPRWIAERRTSVRIWVVGCSTGEEAYSFAMLLHEILSNQAKPMDIKIFATDVHEEAIQRATQGLYQDRELENVPRHLVKKYFTKTSAGYRIKKDIRKMVVFAKHNVLSDPPFINVDLISCRNLLIYFRPESQQRVLSLFHFALNADGHLILGPSESIGKLSHMYSTVSSKCNIFTKYDARETSMRWFVPSAAPVVRPIASPASAPFAEEAVSELKILTDLVRKSLPSFVVVDSADNITYTSGNVEQFIRFPEGLPTTQLFHSLNEPFAIAVRTAIHRARKAQEPVTYAVPQTAFAEKEARIRAIPLDTAQGWVAVFLETVEEEQPNLAEPTRRAQPDGAAPMGPTPREYELETQLRQAEEYLQATREALETSNEELQAANEELIAANEEMQSTNEELQSLNEELITVNTEYQQKIQELTQLNADMDNLLVSTEIGTLFLDENLCVRRFTPSIHEEIPLLDVDIGRPITHIKHRLLYDTFIADIQGVLDTGAPIDRQVQSETGKWYHLRAMPYCSTGQTTGVVLTLNDVTGLKTMNDELRVMSHVVEQCPTLVALADVTGRVAYVNRAFTEHMGERFEDVGRRHIMDLFSEWPEEQKQSIWTRLCTEGESWVGEVVTPMPCGRRMHELAALTPIRNEQGDVIRVLRISEDISSLRQTEELYRQAEMLRALGELAAGVAHEIRNPLTTLKGFAKLASRNAEVKQYTEIMSSELERIEEIVNEMLALGKPQSMAFAPADLSELAGKVIRLMEASATEKSVVLRFLRGLPGEAVVECADNQIQQVMVNLVKNAIEASPHGADVSISVEASTVGGVAGFQVSVADAGPGFAEDVLQRLGQPFVTTKAQGTGLGLMVSQRIVQNHGGQLWVDNLPDGGALVRFWIPSVQAPDAWTA
ncbi:MAG: PAS domain-containing protein [Alicyclobacillus sp.]|nr:PAS domain-containing protein [Alicyclobacillus sp.]